MGFPGGASGKEPVCWWDKEDVGSVPGLGRSPEKGMAHPLQYFCLENCVDRGTLWATVGVAELDTTEATEHEHFVTL